MAHRQILSQFANNEDGATAIEFGILLPILLMFTFGTLEFATMFLAQNSLDNAVAYASRTGKTGYAPTSGQSRDSMILDMVKMRITNIMDPSKLTVSAKTYKSLDQIGQGEPYTDKNGNGRYDAGEAFTDTNGNGKWDSDVGASGYGNSGEVVVYTVTYPWQVMTPFMGNLFTDGGKFPLMAHMTVRNEPWNSGQ